MREAGERAEPEEPAEPEGAEAHKYKTGKAARRSGSEMRGDRA